MIKLPIPILFLMMVSSCITTTNVKYSDPNYLSSDEFSTYETLLKSSTVKNKIINTAGTKPATNGSQNNSGRLQSPCFRQKAPTKIKGNKL